MALDEGIGNTMNKSVQQQGLLYEPKTAGGLEPSLKWGVETPRGAHARMYLDPALDTLHRLAENVALPFCDEADFGLEQASDICPTQALLGLPVELRRADPVCASDAEGKADVRLDPLCGRQLDLLSQHDSALAASIVVDYLSNTSILLWEIGDIATLPSWQRLAQITASLRASSQCLGAVGLATLFGRLERAVARQDLIEFIDVFGRVLDAFPTVSESLLALAAD